MIFIEIFKFLIYCTIIILISKYILVTILRKLAENLNLSARTVGDVAGFATSMPELLTICATSFNGLLTTSIINVLSSNIINFIQYALSIFINKNQKYLNNIALKLDILFVIISILIPIGLISLNIQMGLRNFNNFYIVIYSYKTF